MLRREPVVMVGGNVVALSKLTTTIGNLEITVELPEGLT
jgi:hypothetical protein